MLRACLQQPNLVTRFHVQTAHERVSSKILQDANCQNEIRNITPDFGPELWVQTLKIFQKESLPPHGRTPLTLSSLFGGGFLHSSFEDSLPLEGPLLVCGFEGAAGGPADFPVFLFPWCFPSLGFPWSLWVFSTYSSHPLNSSQGETNPCPLGGSSTFFKSSRKKGHPCFLRCSLVCLKKLAFKKQSKEDQGSKQRSNRSVRSSEVLAERILCGKFVCMVAVEVSHRLRFFSKPNSQNKTPSWTDFGF